MAFTPPIRGKILKKKETPLTPLTESVGEIFKLSQDLNSLKQEVSQTVENLNRTAEEKTQELNQKSKELDTAIEKAKESIEETKEAILEEVKNVQQGNPGKDADEERITQEILSKIPDEAQIIAKVLKQIPQPTPLDEKALIRKVIARLPESKADLKIIKEQMEIDPMSIIEKIMALPEDKFKLKTKNIDGLEQTITAFRNQLARGYLHGGGMTKVEHDTTITGEGTSASPLSVVASATTGITLVQGTSPIAVANGTTTPNISIDLSAYTPTSGLATVATSGSYLDLIDTPTIGTGTVTAVTATTPIISTGGTTPVISMPVASATVNGYLSTPSFNTFNGKVSTVTGTTPIMVTEGITPVVSLNGLNGFGLAGQVIAMDESAIALVWSTPSAGSGTPGGSDTQIQFNDGGSFGGDSGLTYDESQLNVGALSDTNTISITNGGFFGFGTTQTQNPSVNLQGNAFILGFDAAATGSESGGLVTIRGNNGGPDGGTGSGIDIDSGAGGTNSGSGGAITLTAGSVQGGKGGTGAIASVVTELDGDYGTDYTIGDVLTLVQIGSEEDATVTVILVWGVITEVSINEGGTGYTKGDQLTVGGDDNNAILNVDSVESGVITGLSIVSGGTNYTSGGFPLSGGTGNDDASCNATVLVGGVSEVSLTTAGTGYSVGTSAVTGGTGNDDAIISIDSLLGEGGDTGGSVSITAGNGSQSGGESGGGSINLMAGTVIENGGISEIQGANITLYGGNNDGGSGSYFAAAGNGGDTRNGGNVLFYGGSGGISSGNGGNVLFYGGSGQAGDGNGGNITFTPGTKNGSGNTGNTKFQDPISAQSAILDTSLLADTDKTFSFPDKSGTLSLVGDLTPYVLTDSLSPVAFSGNYADLINTPTINPGTVTSVSVVTANGVSGSVANSTATPAITLSLGAITPSSVNGVSISGSSTPNIAITGTATITGSNTGDQDLSSYVTAVTGSSPLSSTGGTTPNLSIPAATTTVAGYLDTPSYNTFNAKVASISGTSPVSVSGTITPVVSMATASLTVNGYLSTPDFTTFNNKVTSITGTAPVTVTGTTTPVISMAAANGTVAGYLDTPTYNTFNAKGSGTVTSFSFTNSNGFTGIVTGATATPALSLSYTGSSSIVTVGTIATGVWNGTAVPVLYGGTGATNAAGAQTNLGLGSMALLANTGSSSITTLGTIATGTWSATAIAVASGGTGGTTAALARTNLGLGTMATLANTGSDSITTLGTIGTGTWNATAITASKGGTGATSLSPTCAVICSGTTTTGAVQVISSLGASGQALTSNGVGALPTWQNKVRVVTTATAATITPNLDVTDQYTVTAMASVLTIATPTGTLTDGQNLIIRLYGATTPYALTWAAAYAAIGVTIPTTTVASKYTYVGCKYNSTSTKFDVLAVGQQA